ncbi:hypothetical protein ACLB2K_033446 [Fragaria x ananassa]
MGGVSSKSVKVCEDRIGLLELACQRRDQLEEAQNKYHDSLGKIFPEILEAQFQVAYKSGNNVSKLLKTEDVGAQSCGEGTFSKLCRSLTTSLSVRVGSACNVELGDKLPRNKQHSSTLKELCEWETKLYNEVKKLDKDGGEVAKSCAVYNFKEIQKLRDGELQQQIGELLKALWRDWKVMSECHSIQKDIMSKAETYDVLKINDASTYKKIKVLKQDLSNWRRCFAAYISSQKAYVGALDSWVSHSFPSFCEDDIHENHILSLLLKTWSSAGLEELPVKEVTDAMKSLEKQVEELKVQLRKEGKQKRKVKRLERRVQELKINVIKFDDEGDDEKLESLEYKLSEEEKALHSRIEKREVAANAVCTGFSSVFESLAEFSETCYEKIAQISVIDKREHVHCGRAKRRLKSITATLVI